MSLFYQSLSPWESMLFKRRKRAFKRGKPCAVCGKLYNDKNKMMVAHVIPVRELSDYDALHDVSNWEVRCIYCERRLNREEDLRKSRLVKSAQKRIGIVPNYELVIYVDYNDMIQHMWDVVMSKLKVGKVYRRSLYWDRLMAQVKKVDRLSLAKAAARYVMSNNGKMPTSQDIYDMLAKDVEAKMLLETNGNFKKEKTV